MRRDRVRLALVGLFVLGRVLVASPAGAKSISITMAPTAQLTDGTLSVKLTVSNRGDEAAQTVVPTLRFLDQQARGQGRSALGPNESMEETLTVPAANLGTGRWPFRVAIDYTDANQYPFQAMHVATVETGSTPPAKVVVQEIQAPALSSSGSFNVKLKNVSGNPRNVAVGVVVPEGSRSPARRCRCRSLPGRRRPSPGRSSIARRSPAAGTRSSSRCEYDDGSTHQTAVAQGIVEIMAPRSFFAQRQRALWVGAGILVALWIGFILWRRPGGAAAGNQA